MNAISSMAPFACALMVSGCAGVRSTPSGDARQALAPTGKLRVGFLVTPMYATKDPASGELRGPAVDLGKELARRIGVPFEPVPFATLPAVLAAARTGEWDVTMIGISADWIGVGSE